MKYGTPNLVRVLYSLNDQMANKSVINQNFDKLKFIFTNE